MKHNDSDELVEVITVRFSPLLKDREFRTDIPNLQCGDPVIVEAERGEELGYVRCRPKFVERKKLAPHIHATIRQATEKDVERVRRMKARAREAMSTCEECIASQSLPMELVDADYAYDGSKLTFFFTSETRVDFRKLVRDLAHIFRTRIELRQIGVRDEARKIGGIGPCGRVTCCASFLSEFSPVSIKMAKNQGLNLSPTKISGLCGRLMCCLNYEDSFYRKRIQEFPKTGQRFLIGEKVYTVTSYNIMVDTIWLVDGEKRVLKLSPEEFKEQARPAPPRQPADKKKTDDRGRGRNG